MFIILDQPKKLLQNQAIWSKDHSPSLSAMLPYVIKPKPMERSKSNICFALETKGFASSAALDELAQLCRQVIPLVSERPAKKRILVINPGKARFLTCYDPSGYLRFWGAASESMSPSDIDDLHSQAAEWIVSEFDVVVHGNFKGSSWRLDDFLSVLKRKAVHKCAVVDILQNNAFRTCGRCGTRNRSISSGDDQFNCETCGLTVLPDLNATRNILMKWLLTHKIVYASDPPQSRAPKRVKL